MGGGDLNLKKSWHPNTMKNQERVWKAEQAAAEEKKRMVELQREHAEERDRAELNAIMRSSSGTTSDNRLAWMYDKPDKKVEQEAFLLGKALDRNTGQSEHVEQDPIPAVSRRVVGSSMLTSAGDTQVDISRKIREDPLLLIKERERAARAALLNNPLQRRRLAELLRKEQDQRKVVKEKKNPKKKDKDLDDILAKKLSALGGSKGLDLETLLDSDSSSDSEGEKSKKKKSKREKKKSKKSKKEKKKHKHSSDNDSDNSAHNVKKSHYEDRDSGNYRSEYKDDRESFKDSRKRKYSGSSRHCESPISPEMNRHKSHKKESSGSKLQYPPSGGSQHFGKEPRHRDDFRRQSPTRQSDRWRDSNQRLTKKRGGMSDKEKAAKLAEMAAAGAEREIQRGKRVTEQRAADKVAEKQTKQPRSSSFHQAHALPDSLESRIHSTRHYIQRDKRHMNENFARR